MPSGIDFNTLSFAAPAYFPLLIVPALLLPLWGWRVVQRQTDIGRLNAGRRLPVQERHTRLGDLGFWLSVLIAAGLAIVALARPQARVSAVRRGSADIVVLQDGSASMYVKDVPPDRWQRSVQFLRTFGEALNWKGDRVALALFAWSAAPQLRLTRDPNAFFFFLDHLGAHSPFRLEDNLTWDTNIEEGVYWGLKLVEKDGQLFGKSKNTKAFMLISDGQAWTGSVAIALQLARRQGIPIYVVGVGTVAGGLIPKPEGEVSASGAGVRAILDRDSLRDIARVGGGDYFELGRESDREIAFSIVSQIKRHTPPVQTEAIVEELYWRFLLYASIVLCLGAVMLRQRTELWWLAAAAVGAIAVLTSTFR